MASPTKSHLIDVLMILLVALLLWWRPLIAAPVTTILDNGDPSNRVDLAILGDGYTAAELSQYEADVANFLAGFFAEPPFDAYQPYVNVHRIEVVSAQSGADHPEDGVFVNTALGATYNCQGIERLICVNASLLNPVLTASVSAIQRDVVIVLVNDEEYGGSGGIFAVASVHPDVVELVLHEAGGHTLGGLADEYSTSPPTCQNTINPPEPNVMRWTGTQAIKWDAWVEATTPIPTTSPVAGLVGLYQGAKYCETLLYRPTNNSKMRSLGVPFESVNVEQLIKRIYTFVSPIDGVTPAPGALMAVRGETLTFSVETPQPMTHALAIDWRVDGVSVGTEPTLALNTGTYGLGELSVEVVVTDPTPLVRSDPQTLLQARESWTVTLVSDEPPSIALQLNQPLFHPGDELIVNAMLRNPGLPLTVDMYVGALMPDLQTILWMTSTNPVAGVWGSWTASPATFIPMLTGVTWPAGMDAFQVNFLRYPWSGGEPRGVYHLLVAWTLPGSLADGAIDPGDLVALGWSAFVVTDGRLAQR